MGLVPAKTDAGIRGFLEKIPPIIRIREERPEDADEIFRIYEKAFSRREEAKLVKTLCRNDVLRLSLLALREKQSVGHILFTQAWIGGGSWKVEGMGLTPLAVLPEFQRQRTGTLLVNNGLKRLKEDGCPFVMVLGGPYYSRFGFRPASGYEVRCAWKVPEDAFQLLVLKHTDQLRLRGPARYRPEFDGHEWPL